MESSVSLRSMVHPLGRLLALFAFTATTTTALLAAASPPSTPRPPNIVFIFADDLGYGDLGCYGATKIKTPNIDRLATQGVRLTDAHAPAAVCQPTRYAILSRPFRDRLLPRLLGPRIVDKIIARRMGFSKPE